MPTLIEQLAFTSVGDVSLEAIGIEYEVEVYLRGYDLAQIKALALSSISQEQWGVYIPKNAANASSGSVRVRKSEQVDTPVLYELTTKIELGDRGKNEHEIPTDVNQFEMFKQMADQGLVKVRFHVPGELEGGIKFTYEVDVFFNAQGDLVPWVKIDAELPEGTPFNPDNLPFTYEEMLYVTPELKGADPELGKKIGQLYKDYFVAKNAYVLTGQVPAEPVAGQSGDDEG